jgi:ribA/ribD-fused uncharacterized protein
VAQNERDYLPFWGHKGTSGSVGVHVLSQWWSAPFRGDSAAFVASLAPLLAAADPKARKNGGGGGDSGGGGGGGGEVSDSVAAGKNAKRRRDETSENQSGGDSGGGGGDPEAEGASSRRKKPVKSRPTATSGGGGGGSRNDDETEGKTERVAPTKDDERDGGDGGSNTVGDAETSAAVADLPERFCNAEHWMMACKARLYSDEETRARIMQLMDPRRIKSEGRKVRGFLAAEWRWKAVCRQIVEQGSWLKFSQNPKLAAYLVSTGARHLVEASPLDKWWGIALPWSTAVRMPPSKWPGKNWLGLALDATRARLVASQSLAAGSL